MATVSAHSPLIPNPFVCRAEHRPVVVAITRCDGGKVKLPKALYTLSFWVRLPEFIVQDFARFGIDVQLVAEQGWVAQLLHERHTELVESIGENDQLRHADPAHSPAYVMRTETNPPT